jgi:tRNA(Ile)-lysidine synthase
MEKALMGAVDRDLVASALLNEYARADLRRALSVDLGIRLDVVREFSELRLINLLRQFLGEKKIPFPTGKQLRECARVMMNAADDAVPSLSWSSFQLVRHKDCMYLLRDIPDFQPKVEFLPGQETIEYGGGLLSMALVEGEGVCLEGDLELRSRQGGESIQLQQRRSLKNIFQENDIPVWLRARLPLVFEQGELIAVPAITTWNTPGVYAENRKPEPGQSGWRFSFEIRDRL